jgi:D-alanyl-D-alanine carboxypeptidase
MTKKDFELLPSVEKDTYVRGVPSRAYLVEIQPEGNKLLGSKHPPQYLDKYAAHAWMLMCRAARGDGLELAAYSAYRSHSHQQRLFKQWEEGTRKLRPATPGWSRHESGRAVDILRSHDDPDGRGPLIGPTDEWLRLNARKFGFYRTVPSELWHYEYRGLPNG